jgi:DNA-binding transcriptional MocR family regulator
MLESASVMAQVEEAKRVYRRRREALLDALAQRGVPGFASSGLNVWIPVPEESRILQQLAASGWAASAGARFRLESGRAIRLTVATLEEAEAEPLAADIAAAMRGGSASLGV